MSIATKRFNIIVNDFVNQLLDLTEFVVGGTQWCVEKGQASLKNQIVDPKIGHMSHNIHIRECFSEYFQLKFKCTFYWSTRVQPYVNVALHTVMN